MVDEPQFPRVLLIDFLPNCLPEEKKERNKLSNRPGAI
uniref:Uncharacterized protein n=1 Tax=Arundo donax TaxID=35708 RepID=A0A0A9DTI7_ARUDO